MTRFEALESGTLPMIKRRTIRNAPARRSGAITLGCLVTLLVIAALLYFGIPAGESYKKYLEYKDAMAQEVRFHARDPDVKIKAHLAVVADSLGLPQDAGKVTITRKNGRLTIASEYEQPFQLPGTVKYVILRPSAAGSY